MPLTPVEFDAMVKATCPRCAAGNVPRWRPETSEYCHDFGGKAQFSHTFCLATGLRKVYEAQQNAEG
jgi:hypothetical protein